MSGTYIQVVSYYINDGVYGSFKHQADRPFTPKVLKVTETLYTKLQYTKLQSSS